MTTMDLLMIPGLESRKIKYSRIRSREKMLKNFQRQKIATCLAGREEIRNPRKS